jgi:Tfp pilus assembly protein PilN
MIKINLLREKKKIQKSSKGQSEFALGLLALGVVAAAMFFFVHSPLADELEQQRVLNAGIKQQNERLKSETAEYDAIKAQSAALQEQQAAIARLGAVRSTPAWFLREMGSILTRGHQPTMTPEMADRVKNDPTLQWNPAWDPKRVWIEKIEEKAGNFTISGGAASDTDATQLWLRLQASVFCTDVAPGATSKAEDSKTKTTYFTFSVTGKVVY